TLRSGPNTMARLEVVPWSSARTLPALAIAPPSELVPSSHSSVEGGQRASHRRPDLPGHELVVAVAQKLALGLLPRGDAQDGVEDLLALGLDRDAVEDVAAIDVHVVHHAAIDVAVGGELDGGRRLAAIGRAAPRGEGQHVAAACHLAGGG